MSEASQEKIRAKVEKLTRIFDRLTAIVVTVDLASVDGAVHKMEQQIRKYKEKIQHRGRTPGSHVSTPSESNPETD
ncbi:MAG: HPF/RaiA family ribosome-associated protein [Planctomycetes bacterium]|nr:HPF/RaiA family ribosome-associated protein [Planctomycetota bacterium]